jgi:replicative DNA helicase
VLIDYVQCLAYEGRESRNQQIAEAMSAMTRAAGEDAILGIGSQLNREGVKAGERPTLANLRDSGVLEQEARCVILLSRCGEDVRDDKGKPVSREILMDIAKNKSDAEGTFTGTFHLRHSCLWPGVERPKLMAPPVPQAIQEEIPMEFGEEEPF